MRSAIWSRQSESRSGVGGGVGLAGAAFVPAGAEGNPVAALFALESEAAVATPDDPVWRLRSVNAALAPPGSI